MPTPRPASSVTSVAVENPGAKIELHQLAIAHDLVAADKAALHATRTDAIQRDTGAVVGNDNDDFVALLAHLDRQLADFAFACGGALRRCFQSVHDGVAHQVLERAAHALQHAAIDLDIAAADLEIDPFVELLRGLAGDPVQTFGDVRKRHQPHAHQLLLQVARQARLRREVLVGHLQALEHVALDHCHVFDGLGKQPRQFLQARVAIEFQRIECSRLLGKLIGARLDLCVGLDLHLAQLRAQTPDVFREVQQRALERADFVFEFRACDRYLAGLVDELVEHIGPDADVRRGLRRSPGIAALPVAPVHQPAREQRRGAAPGFASPGIARGIDGARRNARPGAVPAGSAFAAAFGACRRCRYGLGAGRMLQALVERHRVVILALQILDDHVRDIDELHRGFDARLHLVHEFTQAHRACHPRTAFDSVHLAHQLARDVRSPGWLPAHAGRRRWPATDRGPRS